MLHLASTELIGYVASGLVLCTFAMRSMVPLRLVALASNVAFISYGWLAGLCPVLGLHLILFPLNSTHLLVLLRSGRSDHGARPNTERAELVYGPVPAGIPAFFGMVDRHEGGCCPPHLATHPRLPRF